MAIEFVKGDITKQDTEAIANAANSRLAGGGGVDGAVHRAGGPEIMRELKEKYRGCPTGSGCGCATRETTAIPTNRWAGI